MLVCSLDDLIKSSSKGSRGGGKAAGGVRGKLGKKKAGQKVRKHDHAAAANWYGNYSQKQYKR